MIEGVLLHRSVCPYRRQPLWHTCFGTALRQRGEEAHEIGDVVVQGHAEPVAAQLDGGAVDLGGEGGVLAQGCHFGLQLGNQAGQRLQPHAFATRWTRLAALMYRHGESVYNFQGLRRYKEKFDPSWEPRYLATTSRLALPRVLLDVMTLISGGVRGLVTKG